MVLDVVINIKSSKKNNYLIILLNYRTKRLFTYQYILSKEVNDLKKEMLKKENMLVPMVIILKKVISFEKLVIPRLKIFEEVCPSSIE